MGETLKPHPQTPIWKSGLGPNVMITAVVHCGQVYRIEIDPAMIAHNVANRMDKLKVPGRGLSLAGGGVFIRCADVGTVYADEWAEAYLAGGKAAIKGVPS